MKITPHIERLVLGGIQLGPGQRPLLQAAVETELARLLAAGELNHALQSGCAFYNVRTAGIESLHGDNPTHLGELGAGAVYGGIGE